MPSVVIKPDPDDDLYVIWSTVTDGPGFRGTRADVAQALATHPEHYGTTPAEERLARADRQGSSAMGPWQFGWWGDAGFVVGWDHEGEREIGFRWLPRRNLHAWLTSGDESLTEPVED